MSPFVRVLTSVTSILATFGVFLLGMLVAANNSAASSNYLSTAIIVTLLSAFAVFQGWHVNKTLDTRDRVSEVNGNVKLIMYALGIHEDKE
jgi:hypothetical protein